MQVGGLGVGLGATYATSLPSMNSRASNFTFSGNLLYELVNLLTTGGFQEWMDTRKGVPVGRLGTKQQTVGRPNVPPR